MNDQQRAAMQMALEALNGAVMLYSVRDIHPAAIKVAEEAITTLREALAQPQDHSEQHLNMVQGEWVAWRVTGAFEDMPFKDRSSAEAYRKGLNDGYGSDAYSVSPLYTTPPSVEAAIKAALLKQQELWIQATEDGIEAAIKATKEKAAKIADDHDKQCTFKHGLGAAIRSMK